MQNDVSNNASIKNAVLWDHLGGTVRLHLQSRRKNASEEKFSSALSTSAI
jgi:hypothetical protein